MAKNQPHHMTNHQAELAKLLRTVGLRHGHWQVFRDFVAMAAIALSNAVDKRHFDKREAEYMGTVGRYSKDEANALARGFAYVVDALETGHHDFLGSLFMSMELGDKWKGQVFTPYEVCLMMSMMIMGDKPQQEIARKGFVTINDPCIGGGAMVIAAAHTLHNAGINYQQHMHAVAADIDIVAVHMAYIQLSLLHVPAVIYHANSLSMEIWSEWRTPAHVLGFWDSQLRRAGDSSRLIHIAPAPIEIPAPMMAAAPILPAASVIAAHSTPINLRGQISLF